MNVLSHEFAGTTEIPDTDQRAFKDALAELLDRGSLLGFEPRTRDLYQRAAGVWLDRLKTVLSLLDMELIHDDDRLLLQARPTDSCALVRRFDQTESLFALGFWRVYHEHRVEGRAGAVMLTLDDFFGKLKSYLPTLLQNPPKIGTFNRVLGVLQRRNMVRFSWNEVLPGQTEIQVLPTILYVIPFANLETWTVQMDKFGELPQVQTDNINSLNEPVT